MKYIMISIILATSIISCQGSDIDCGLKVLEIEKDYMFRIERAAGDKEGIRQLYKEKLIKLNNTGCF